VIIGRNVQSPKGRFVFGPNTDYGIVHNGRVYSVFEESRDNYFPSSYTLGKEPLDRHHVRTENTYIRGP
jgi:acyl-CoA thioesterase FadM